MPTEKYFKILIVEDESLIGWTFANALKKVGYESDIVECGEDAIRKMKAISYDLVISDNRLPHIDGFVLASCVKSISKKTPVIIVGAKEDMRGAESGQESGSEVPIDYYLEKPFNVDDMVAMVQDILKPGQSKR